MPDTEQRVYRSEPLSGLTPFLIAAKLTQWEHNGWRLAALVPFSPGYAVNDLYALLYRLPVAADADVCHCPACGTAHRSKGG